MNIVVFYFNTIILSNHIFNCILYIFLNTERDIRRKLYGCVVYLLDILNYVFNILIHTIIIYLGRNKIKLIMSLYLNFRKVTNIMSIITRINLKLLWRIYFFFYLF